MAKTNKPLTPQQYRAIELLSQGLTYTAIAEELDCNRITISRWIAKPEFAAALNAQQHEIQKQVNGEIRNMQMRAIETIDSLLDDPDVGERTRLDAAKYVLERAAVLPELRFEGLPVAAVEQFAGEILAETYRSIGGLVVTLGLVPSVEAYLEMPEHGKANIAIICESMARFLESGEVWKPAADDPLYQDLIETHRAAKAGDN